VTVFSPPDVSEAMAIFYGLLGADGGAEWKNKLAGGPIDARMKDLLMLAGAPNVMRGPVAAMLRLHGQPWLARTML